MKTQVKLQDMDKLINDDCKNQNLLDFLCSFLSDFQLVFFSSLARKKQNISEYEYNKKVAKINSREKLSFDKYNEKIRKFNTSMFFDILKETINSDNKILIISANNILTLKPYTMNFDMFILTQSFFLQKTTIFIIEDSTILCNLVIQKCINLNLIYYSIQKNYISNTKIVYLPFNPTNYLNWICCKLNLLFDMNFLTILIYVGEESEVVEFIKNTTIKNITYYINNNVLKKIKRKINQSDLNITIKTINHYLDKHKDINIKKCIVICKTKDIKSGFNSNEIDCVIDSGIVIKQVDYINKEKHYISIKEAFFRSYQIKTVYRMYNENTLVKEHNKCEDLKHVLIAIYMKIPISYVEKTSIDILERLKLIIKINDGNYVITPDGENVHKLNEDVEKTTMLIRLIESGSYKKIYKDFERLKNKQIIKEYIEKNENFKNVDTWKNCLIKNFDYKICKHEGNGIYYSLILKKKYKLKKTKIQPEFILILKDKEYVIKKYFEIDKKHLRIITDTRNDNVNNLHKQANSIKKNFNKTNEDVLLSVFDNSDFSDFFENIDE